jgi:hypothetical protein
MVPSLSAACIGFSIQNINPHFSHQRPDMTTADLVAVLPQKISHHPAPGKRPLKVQLVDSLHQLNMIAAWSLCHLMLLLSAVFSSQLGKITTYPLVQFSESRSINAFENRKEFLKVYLKGNYRNPGEFAEGEAFLKKGRYFTCWLGFLSQSAHCTSKTGV